MAYMMVRHRVKDISAWKSIFDEHGSTRADAGCKGGELFRFADDPNHVVIVFEWDNVDNARKFAQSEDLRKTMARAGVVDTPTINFLERVEKFAR